MSEPIKYGCYCDLDDEQKPDSCVWDVGKVSDCSLASSGISKHQCPHWKPIVMHADPIKNIIDNAKADYVNEHKASVIAQIELTAACIKLVQAIKAPNDQVMTMIAEASIMAERALERMGVKV